MVNWGAIVMATIVWLVPGLDSQCVDCNKVWKAFCHTTKSGHFCTPGAFVHSLVTHDGVWVTKEPDKYNLFLSCTPRSLDVEYVAEWCCFWSEKVGCQVGLHPKTYKFQDPHSYCSYCRSKCVCANGALLVAVQPWHWGYLIILTLLVHCLV